MAAAVAATAAVLVAAAPSRATFAGANGLLVYQAKVDKHIQLFTIRPDGSGARRITNLRDSDAVEPSWSPDGNHIAFARDYAVDTPKEHLDIAVVNADGSGLQHMHLSGLNGAPTWRPDGRVLWLRAGGLAVGNATGRGFRMIRVGGENGSPTVSPDGKHIALRRQVGGTSAIYVVNADGSNARRVVAPAGGVADKIDWSPDGSRIVFSAPEFGRGGRSSNVFTIRPDGHGLRQLTHARGGKVNNGADSWAPDGKKIAFVSNRRGTYQIYVMNNDGTGVARLTRGPEAHLAAWGTHPAR